MIVDVMYTASALKDRNGLNSPMSTSSTLKSKSSTARSQTSASVRSPAAAAAATVRRGDSEMSLLGSPTRLATTPVARTPTAAAAAVAASPSGGLLSPSKKHLGLDVPVVMAADRLAMPPHPSQASILFARVKSGIHDPLVAEQFLRGAFSNPDDAQEAMRVGCSLSFVCKLMKQHEAVPDVTVAGCQAVLACVDHDDMRRGEALAVGAMDRAVGALLAFPTNVDLQLAALHVVAGIGLLGDNMGFERNLPQRARRPIQAVKR